LKILFQAAQPLVEAPVPHHPGNDRPVVAIVTPDRSASERVLEASHVQKEVVGSHRETISHLGTACCEREATAHVGSTRGGLLRSR